MTRTEDAIRQGALHEYYPDLYGEACDQAELDDRYRNLVRRHIDLFGPQQTVHLFSTSGRSELAGNHTDHNHGRVLAASISLDTIAAVSPADCGSIILDSVGFPPVSIDLGDLSKRPQESGTTEALLRGIAHRFQESGAVLKGLKISTESRVLKGSGLSSSAAIEVLIATIFNELFFDSRFSTTELAIIGQYAENVYFDKPSGLMDQIACANGGIVAIDFADPKAPLVSSCSFDFKSAGYTLVVVDTKGSHADLTDHYAAIPQEMKQVARYFGREVCRGITEEEFLGAIPALRQRFSDRAVLRAWHFIQEDERAGKMHELLSEGRLAEYFDYVNASGHSSEAALQNIYPSTNPEEQGLSLALCLTRSFLGTQGAVRVHGGGFAGTIAAYIPNSRVAAYSRLLDPIFGEGCVTELSIRKSPTARLL